MNPIPRKTMSWLPVFNNLSRAIKVQKFGMIPKIYLKSLLIKNANNGRKKTPPSILKTAKACTLLLATILAISPMTGVKSASSTAIGR